MASGIIGPAEAMPEELRGNLRNYAREPMRSGAAFEDEPGRVLRWGACRPRQLGISDD
jgi:hypothetical protein